MKRLVIFLNDQEAGALRRLADREFRDPRAQATLIIRNTLRELGLLETNSEPNPNQEEAQNEGT